ncbi:hypothetical protein PC9H_000680 [Pleurotus ostreatus]|uniref:Uncharacterized protein n=2 Tax=Pleurotus ostreatus TaxID=5322 RepID=A0A067P1K7_PLEO1|nr:uncharacterized protein PC9H_000680 [Pleurotus ostreatus]KAF7440336.1 hypothetical protein PC9H_000680 [Pleurotus ostreatus]KDQ33125.1 hypothetical protein PLEOSDRAFT_1110416 [Pleurotus ostreatus PC15]
MAFNIREISNLSGTLLIFVFHALKVELSLRRYPEAKLTELSVLAAAAFEGDGFLLAAVGSDPTLNVSYHRAQMIAATMAGKIVVAEDAQDGSVVGVALWFPPGITIEDQDRIAFQPFITKCPPSIQTWWNDHFLVEHPKSCQRMFGRNWFNNAWQLELLAIAPGHQGKGIGSALKEQNVRFYQRLGFVLRGKYEFNSNSGGFPLFCMTAARYTL